MLVKTKIEILIAKIFEKHITYDVLPIDIVEIEPDIVVLDKIQKLGLENFENYIVHSTSWHYENRKIVLTYLAILPQEENYFPKTKLDIKDVDLANAEKTYIPTPKSLEQENIIRHAFRHLAYLLKHDYDNKYSALLDRKQINYVLSVYDEVAKEVMSII